MYIYCVTYVSEVIVEEKNDQIHPFPRRKGERTYFRQRGTHACKERMKKKKRKNTIPLQMTFASLRDTLLRICNKE